MTSDSAISRRSVLGAGALGALGAVSLTLAPMSFAESTPPAGRTGTRSRTITGHLDPGAADFVYLPVRVPHGVNRIDVGYTYAKPAVDAGVLGNACDIGIFDERGTELGTRGFRGWSGGARTSFTVSASDATPGYLPGPVNEGTWHVVLGPYQVAPQGLDYSVQVTLTYGPDAAPFGPQYPPQRVAGRGAGWFRGDSHLHTVYSDGGRTPAEVAAGARAAGLDFIVTTEHNTSSAHAAYGPYAGDDLLVVTGEEVTTRNGHYLAIGLPPGEWVDWRYRSVDGVFDRFARQIHRGGGIVVPAHPYGTSLASRWKFGYGDVDAVEVWNGPWSYDDESALDTWDSMLVASARGDGPWLPAMGNSDAHREPNVIGLPQTVVHADGLSRDALVAGLSAGRSWLAESSAVQLDLSASARGRTAGIGERLRARPGDTVRVTARVQGVPDGVVRLISDEGQVQQTSLPAGGAGSVTWTTTRSYAAYVRVEVRHPRADGTPGNGGNTVDELPYGPMAALTNPVWLG